MHFMNNKRSIFSAFVNVRDLVTLALLITLGIVFGRMLSFYVPVPLTQLKVDFGSPAMVILAGMIYGPIAGAFAGFAVDTLGFLILNTSGMSWNPQIMLAYVVYGFVAGLIYWLLKKFIEEKYPLNFKQIVSICASTILAHISGFFFINWGMALLTQTTIWVQISLRIFYQPLFWVWYCVLAIMLMMTYLAIERKQQ
jgi:ECF transporter S component (folate family)